MGAFLKNAGWFRHATCLRDLWGLIMESEAKDSADSHLFSYLQLNVDLIRDVHLPQAGYSSFKSLCIRLL